LRGWTSGGKPALESAHLPEGVFVVEGWELGESIPEPVRVYDATTHAEEILKDVTALDPESTEALLGFVRRWGLLGLSLKESRFAYPTYDAVLVTRAELKKIAHLARMVRAIQLRRWSDPALPSIEEARRLVLGAPEHIAKKDRGHLYRLAYVRELDSALEEHPLRAVLAIAGKRIEPILLPQSLLGVLYVALWRLSASEEQELRPCRGCGGLFPVSRTNTKKRYCSNRCKSRRNFRRWYSRPENREKRKARRVAGGT
jgi:hypothetical protein